jgi:ubiquitin
LKGDKKPLQKAMTIAEKVAAAKEKVAAQRASEKDESTNKLMEF